MTWLGQPLLSLFVGRRRPSSALSQCLWLAAALSWQADPARAEVVDLALVLAVDVSGSIGGERYELRRRGYA
jgi:hypothetical protein